MKQLAIFKPTITESLEADFKKRLRRNKRKLQLNHQSGNLWQEKEDHEQEMTLFFLDIRDFTPIVEKYEATDVIYMVRKLLATFQNIIRANHGEIIETTGDGFYAAFGFNNDIRSSANAAVRAGHAILEALEHLNDSFFEEKLDHRLEIGIGVHAGKVATGNISLHGNDHRIVMGYPVNIASRLEAATKEMNNSFIVSSVVYDLLKDKPADKRTAEISLKGVKGMCKIHLLGKPYDRC